MEPQKAHDTSLLTETDNDFLGRLSSLFYYDQLTAHLSSQVIVAVNNFSIPGRSAPEGLKSSIDGTKDVAARAYARLKHRQENQAIVFYGDSGSGKTTLRSHLLTSLLDHSASSPQSAKLSYAAYIFDSLTTTRTNLTPTASKSGLFYELQYDFSDGEPVLHGGKLLDHRLDRSRVTSAEANYHIFYYLICGTNETERDRLKIPFHSMETATNAQKLAFVKSWRYLDFASSMPFSYENASDGFSQFKRAMQKLDFTPAAIVNICIVLSAILYLGQIKFRRGAGPSSSGTHSGGYASAAGDDVVDIQNHDVLELAAALLGLTPETLKASLSYKSKMLKNERVTILLDPKGARENADELSRTLYSLLVAYIMEHINTTLCAQDDSFTNVISIVDFPGPATVLTTDSTIDLLLTNTANETLYNFSVKTYYDDLQELLSREEVHVPPTDYLDNAHTVETLKNGKCLLSILDVATRDGMTDMLFLDKLRTFYEKKHKQLSLESQSHKILSVDESSTVLPGSNFSTANKNAKFTVRHYHGPVDYDVNGLVEANGEIISGDLATLIATSHRDFVRELFNQDALNAVHHKNDPSAIIRASVSSKPTRKPSLLKKGGRQPRMDESTRTTTKSAGQGAAGQYMAALDNIWSSLTSQGTNSYFYFCLRSNGKRDYRQFDSKFVRNQAINYGLFELRKRIMMANMNILVPFDHFLARYPAAVRSHGSMNVAAESVILESRWPVNEARAGLTGVLLSERLWFEWAGLSIDSITGARSLDGRGYASNEGIGDMKTGLLSDKTSSPDIDYKNGYMMETKSEAGYSAINDVFRGMDEPSDMAEKVRESKLVEVESHPMSGSRKRWLAIVWMLTFYMPDFVVKRCSKNFKNDDVRYAWREKVAINILIWLSCGLVMFFMVGFPALICPKQHVYSAAELSSKNGEDKNDAFVSMRGVVYDLEAFAPVHYPSIVSQESLMRYAGMDITNLFPVQVSALCNGVDGRIDPAVQLDYRNNNYTGAPTAVSRTDRNARYHDFRWATNDSRPDWWWEQQIYLKANYMKGRIGYSPEYVKTLGSKGNAIAILNNKVYDFTNYIPGGRAPQYPDGYKVPSSKPSSDFMDERLVTLFRQRAGTDITKYWEALRFNAALRTRMNTCMNNLFYVGDVDTRNSTKCKFSKYLLLAISIFLVSVIGFKFLAALQFTRKPAPEDLYKFVICTVPAYTEDEDSLRRAIDSIARMKYDDKRKLLVVICDGMIIGQGNDRPTPQIVLDILGVSPDVQPEALSFLSLGEGQKQHNMGKIYTGLYEVQGHIVPFMVVVKVGRPSETSKPGNRGKRDSQMVLMRFLNRVHYNLPMAPMELEMYHQIRNVIGVDPKFYDFFFQIDADTVVAPDSATRLIASCLHDTRIIGICGETELTNAKSSFVTMIQVYEYFISHNMIKAFESLFGSVTCLPGCFSIYRVRDDESGKPLFVSKDVVEAYAENRVDTLHMKNLLHLGEDRYLTTLLMKFHSKYKTKFNSTAKAWTIAPDSWSVFLSQRRRWINSTVHNLIELIPLTQLCGFCCFSMRFVVFLDLLSTIVQPVIIGYIAYLIYLIVDDSSILPVTAFILLGAVYGLQAIIFLLRRKWEMIAWMIIYILATPVFAFALPLYSFWHMDDFSWGNTRVVLGDKGQQIIVSDEGKFDPASIPTMKWSEYEAELMEDRHRAQQQGGMMDDGQSVRSGFPYAHSMPGGGGSVFNSSQSLMAPLGNDSFSRPASTVNLGGHRMSMAGTAYGMMSVMGDNGLPSDEEILEALRELFHLQGQRVLEMTKRQIRTQLEHQFNTSLRAREAYINEQIGRLLADTNL